MKPKFSRLSFVRSGSRAAMAGVITLCMAGAASAVDLTWNSASGDFNTASNWFIGTGPGTGLPGTQDNANIGNGGIANFSAGERTILQLRAGNGAGATVNFTGGTFTATNGMWAGRQNGTDTATVNVSGAGTVVNITGENTRVGNASGGAGVPTAGATGVLNISAGGTFNHTPGGTTFRVGDKAGITANSGTYKGTLNVNGGTLNLPASELFIGNEANGEGVANLGTGGIINVNNWVCVGRNGGTGSLEMTGGTITKGGGTGSHFAIGTGGNGTFNQSGGDIRVNAGEFFIGNEATGQATYNLSGGTVTVDNYVVVARLGATGTMDMTGGSFIKKGNGNFVVGAGTAAQNNIGTVNLSGGTIDIQTGQLYVGEGSNTNFTISNSAELKASDIQLAVTNTPHLATLSLDGGTVRTGRFYGGEGNAKIEFNGSTVHATRHESSFLNNIDQIEIQEGGAIIHSNGYNLSVPTQTLGGTGGLTKQGAGTLSLLANNTYTGTTTISGGKVIVAHTTDASGPVNVAANAGFGVNVVDLLDEGTGYTTSAMTLAANSTLDINMGNNPTEYGSPIQVDGALTINGGANTITINVEGTDFYEGTFQLIKYTSLSGSGGFPSFKLGTLPLGVTANLVHNTAQKRIDLNVTRYVIPKWSGSTSDQWDINATPNWIDTEGSPMTFRNGDPAIFDDEGTATDVKLGVTASPSALIFENSAKPYTLSGAGKVSGSAYLTKRGAGTADISTVNDFTGSVRVEGGVLGASVIANGGVNSSIGKSTSAADSVTLGGGVLSYTGANPTSTDRSFTVTGTNSGVGVAQAASGLTVTGKFEPSSTSSGFIKSGAGTLTVTTPGQNSLASSGIVRVTGGSLVFDSLDASAPQSIHHNGEFYVGAEPEIGGNLTLNNSSLTTTNWLALGRGTGTNDSVSTITLNNSTLTVNQFSAGYANGVADNKGTQRLILNDSKFTNNGINNLAENRGSTTHVELNGNSEYTTIGGNTPLRIGLGGGAEEGAAVAHFTISDNSKVVVGSPDFTRYTSVGYSGGGHMTIEDNGSFTSFHHFSINEDSPVPSTVTVKDNGSLTMRLTYIGRFPNRQGTLIQSGGSVSTREYDMIIGLHGNGAYQMSGGTASVGGWISLGNSPAAANNPAGVGTIDISGGTFNQTAENRAFVVGDGISATAAATGIMNISGSAVVNAAEFRIGWSNQAVGTVTQTGGSTRVSKGILMGESATTRGTYDINAGTLDVNTIGGHSIRVGNNGSGSANFVVGGTADVKLHNSGSLQLAGGNTSQNNALTMNGGSLTFLSDSTAVGGTGQIVIGSATATGTNAVNLNGGVLTVPGITSLGGNSQVNLNGGTLRAAAPSATFISGVDRIHVYQQGGTIDTNGHDVTVVDGLIEAGGAGNITKQGTGTLTLAGQNSYLGSTNVTAGNVTLAEGAKMTFFVNNGQNSRIHGSGTATLNGAIDISLGVDFTAGDESWNLVQSSATYGAGFSVVGFTESSGVWTKTDANGTWTFTESTGVLQLGAGGTPPTNAYNAWIAGFFPGETDPEIIGMDKDPDGDGVPNALEFALGGSPDDGNNRAKVYTIKADSNGDSQQELILTIAVRSGTPAFTTANSPVSATTDGLTTYTIQGSVDLGGFTSKVTPLATPVVTGSIPTNAPSGYEYRSFSLDASNGLPNKGFLRVKVDY